MRRALKISGWVAGTVLVLAAMLIAAVLIGGNTDSGRELIERLTYRLTAGHVNLVGLGGSFPQQLTLDRLVLSDERGVWLNIEHISLRWSPLALIERRIQIEDVRASRVRLERSPIAAKSSGSPYIPHVDVAQLTVDTFELSQQLAGAPASLYVHGSGRLHSLQDAAADLIARRTDGDGRYEVHFRFDPKRMQATLHLDEPAHGPLENLLKVPGLGALTANLNLNGPRGAEQFQIVIDAGSLHGQAQGSFDLTHRTADFDFALSAPAMSPHQGLAWQRIALQGRSHGSIGAPVADGRLQVDELQLPDKFRIASFDANLAASAGTLVMHALAERIEIPGPQPRLLRESPLTLGASMRLNDDNRPLELTASHRLFSLRAQAMTAGQQRATLVLRLLDLAPLASLASQDVRGSATINANLTHDGKDLHVALDAIAALAGGKALWSSTVGPRAQLQLSAKVSDQAVLIERARLTGRSMALALTGSLSRPTPDAGLTQLLTRWDLDLPNLSALSPAIAGRAKVSGALNGPLSALTADARLKSMLSVRGSPSGAVSAEMHVRNISSAPRGTLLAAGTLDGAPLKLDVSMETHADHSVHALIHAADWKSAHIYGDLAGGTASTRAFGLLHLKVDQLSDLNRLIGMNIGGSLLGNATLTSSPGGTNAKFELDAKNLSTGQFSADAQLTGAGLLNALGLKLVMHSPNLNGEPVSATLTALLNLDAHNLLLQHGHAEYHAQTLRLLTPASLSFADGLSVDKLRLGARHAVLELAGRVSPVLDVHASLHVPKPDLINAFVPDFLSQGTIEADAQLQGSIAAPTGQLRVDATDMRLAEDSVRGLSTFEVHAGAKLMGTTAQVDAALTASGNSLLKVDGRVPLAASGTLDLKVEGAFDFGLINPLLEAHGLHAAGQLNIDAMLSGSASDPKVAGAIKLTNGNLRDYGRGVNLSNISAQINGSEGMLRIDSFNARAASGNLSMTGTIGILQHGIPVDLHLIAKNAQPIVSKIITANLDGDIHVTGTARERLEIAGTINLIHSTIGIPSSFPPNVAVLDVRRRGQPVAAPRQLTIGLDVAIHAPQRILVQGRGLDAELVGDLHVSGTTDAPLVNGGFDLQRGSFSLASSKLELQRPGRISFNSAGLQNKIDPTLDFTAQTTVSDAVATLRISGFADSPKFDFSSNPALPQDEILARLLFGVPASQLTALQLAQIGAALATLSGVGGDGLNPLVKLQKSLGLDRLSVGAGTSTGATGTQNSGASIEAGRYVSKRVYVEAKQNSTGSSQLQVDVDLTKHLKLQTRLGNGTATAQGTTPENDPGSSIGLSYQFEY